MYSSSCSSCSISMTRCFWGSLFKTIRFNNNWNICKTKCRKLLSKGGGRVQIRKEGSGKNPKINKWGGPLFGTGEQKTSTFICIPKINFIIHFFLEILHFKESWYLIGWQHSGPQLENQNFARYGIGGEVSVTILVFILDYSQKKLITKYFKK